ncbi:hypothetical protein DFP97_106307 [Paenibacillus prosopidis]|uniref:Uncharacterized protein n=1 Tax=Paenibacillus prosopidis TaxID=630520 RepID=A0A368W831_9BACL|nr:hypothetical protein DFP97_106307 [Paenibacillus prosopidis]
MEAKLKVYKDINFSFSNGESTIYAQRRAVKVIENILNENMGKKIVMERMVIL